MEQAMQRDEHPEDVLPEDFVDELLDRREASAYLASIGVRRKPATLTKLLSIGCDGPPCVHEGRRPLYPKRRLHDWGLRQLIQIRRSAKQMRLAAEEGDASPLVLHHGGQHGERRQ
jgi:hypothetical protein